MLIRRQQFVPFERRHLHPSALWVWTLYDRRAVLCLHRRTLLYSYFEMSFHYGHVSTLLVGFRITMYLWGSKDTVTSIICCQAVTLTVATVTKVTM